MFIEKKCHMCNKETICAICKMAKDNAVMLNAMMNKDISGKNGFQAIVDAIAHDCRFFEPVPVDKV